MNKIYIHYGTNKFNPDLFIEPGYNEEWTFKPVNGLWASEDTDDSNVLTWKRWCLMNNFYVGNLNQWFRFKLSDDAKGFVIKDSSIIDTPYVKYYNTDLPIHKYSRMIIDFDKLKEGGFTHIEFIENSWTQWTFPLWDVDCILIIDPNVIVPVE